MAVENWLGIIDKTLQSVDSLTEEQLKVLSRSLDRSFDQVSRNMVRLHQKLEGRDPEIIQIELSRLRQLNIARQLLSPQQEDKFNKQFEQLVQQQYTQGQTFADLMVESLSNPPEIVQQFGNINIEAAGQVSRNATQRLRNHSETAAKNIIELTQTNLLNGGSVNDLRKGIQKELGVTKHRAEVIARTETLTAMNQSALKRYQQYGAAFVQLLALVDQRTTPWCRYRHMKIIKITDSMPPYHYQCRTVFSAVDPAWLDDNDLKWMQEQMAEAKTTGLSSTGKAPFDSTKPTFVQPTTFIKRGSV